MFEDILGSRSLREKVKTLFDGEACPTCSSVQVKTIYGIFVSATKYVHSLQCEVCEERWSLIYDGDLNVIETKIGV